MRKKFKNDDGENEIALKILIIIDFLTVPNKL